MSSNEPKVKSDGSLQWGQPDETPEDQQKPREMATFGNGGVSLVIGGDVQREPGQSATAQDIIASTHGGKILATANEMTLRPSTVVTIPGAAGTGGIQLTLAMAERLGYVTRDATGRYTEIGTQPPAAPEQAAQETPEAGDVAGMQPEAFSEGAEAALSELVKDTDPGQMAEALADIGAQYIAKGGDLMAAINIERIASRTGLSNEKAAQFVAGYFGQLADQIDGVLEKSGIGAANAQAFMTWAIQHQPRETQQAWVNHSVARTASGWRSLAQQYLRTTAVSAEGLKTAGFETMKDAKGELLVKLDGMWTSAKAAARAGRI